MDYSNSNSTIIPKQQNSPQQQQLQQQQQQQQQAHNFTNFINTLPQLTNYQHWEQGENYVLDKDIKISGNKTYSLETCQFVPSSENIAESANRRWHGTNDPVLT